MELQRTQTTPRNADEFHQDAFGRARRVPHAERPAGKPRAPRTEVEILQCWKVEISEDGRNVVTSTYKERAELAEPNSLRGVEEDGEEEE